MARITVTALQDFDYKGIPISRGDVVEMEPVYALAHKYKGRVKLGAHPIAKPAPAAPAPQAEPEAEPPTPRKRRAYRRADMTAED